MIDPSTLPYDELELFQCISTNYFQLMRFQADFRIACALFQFLKQDDDPQLSLIGVQAYNYRMLAASRPSHSN